MSRLVVPIVVALALAACGEAKTGSTETPASAPAAAPGPPTYDNLVAKPASYKDVTVEFPIVLAAGDIGFISGEKGTAAGQSWNDASGKEHSVAPAPGYVAGKPCVFVVVDDKNTPLTPLQPVVVDNMVPCFVESSFHFIKLSGKVAEVRDIQLEVDKAVSTVKAPVLTDINLVTPKL